MKSVVEALEGNKVKLSVEVDQVEFESAVDAAFHRIAREVRIPGFRPGKVPRKVLEARLGKDAARQEALREALPEYYAQAVRENEVDPIAPPEIDITSEEGGGPLTFDAVVEIRPTVAIPGYAGLQVTVPALEVSDGDVSAQMDRLRDTFAELKETSRPAQATDHVTIDITGTRNDERVDAVSTEDFLYEVGSGSFLPELDDVLRGAKVGDILTFEALGDGEEGAVSFRVLVKDLKAKVLPELTDEWASEASEFETVDELRADLRQRLELVRRVQGRLALREATLGALVELVAEDAPEPLVNAEMERQVHELGHRLEAQGANLGQYLAATGQDQEVFVADLRERAVRSVKADLALRALAEAEAMEVADSDIEAELASMADRYSASPADLAHQLEEADQMDSLRSDLRKGKALNWLLEHVEVVDEEGRPVDRSLLDELPVEALAGGAGTGDGGEAGGDPPSEASGRETIDETDQTAEVPS